MYLHFDISLQKDKRMNHIIIVESPAKARTLKNFLGAKYNIKASMGHIRDLPKKELRDRCGK